MRTRVIACLPAAAAAALLTFASCRTSGSLSSDLGIRICATRPFYMSTGNFHGTLTFVNKGPRTIRESFPTSCQYNVVFYDDSGTARAFYPLVSFQMATGFSLGPFEARVEPLDFPISNRPEFIPGGFYRVRASVEGHEEIYSETIVAVLPAM